MFRFNTMYIAFFIVELVYYSCYLLEHLGRIYIVIHTNRSFRLFYALELLQILKFTHPNSTPGTVHSSCSPFCSDAPAPFETTRLNRRTRD